MKDAIAPVTLALPPGPHSVLVPTDGRVRPPSRTNGDGSGERRAPEPSFPAPDAARLGILIFLGAETMLFAGFVAAFLVFRLGAPVWPPPLQPRLPLGLTGVNTAVLLLSGAALWRGRLGPTVLLGGAFLLLQGYEWTRLLAFGLTADSGVYGGTFYAVIGAHAVHALAGLAWLAALWLSPAPSRRLAATRLYWSFVVGLWPVLYTLVYLS